MRAAILMLRSAIHRPITVLRYRSAAEEVGLADLRRHDIVPWLFG
jgi:hypothetical protein